MAFPTVPFGLQNAAHNANLFRQAVASIIPPGGGLARQADLNITQTGTPSMAVLLGVGRLWIPGTNVSNVAGGTFSTQAMYYTENESAITVPVTASSPTLPRVDVIYVAIQDSQYSGTQNQVSTTFIATGAPISGASYPANAPAIPNNALAIGYIIVRANSTSILNSDITNLVLPVFGAPVSTVYAPLNGTYTTTTGTITQQTITGITSLIANIQFIFSGTSPTVGTTFVDLGQIIPTSLLSATAPTYYGAAWLAGGGAGYNLPINIFLNPQTGHVLIRQQTGSNAMASGVTFSFVLQWNP